MYIDNQVYKKKFMIIETRMRRFQREGMGYCFLMDRFNQKIGSIKQMNAS